ncbi:DUF1398 domain-containing protein [Roseococcus sp. YIM B11640]|uniref:DUF1398 domain-containing protein n=1 Tax=Roseococcus sp. YIM B11640 TaxID=3133973 RepID=UPI003C7E6823
MDDQQQQMAQACLEAADTGRMTFPQIVDALMRAGFESYAIDYRRGTATFYLPDGESLELPAHREPSVAEGFDVLALQAAIREAQQLVPGYSYRGFCRKAAAAGCAGYIVSFAGRRALYFGRAAETHTELFPR